MTDSRTSTGRCNATLTVADVVPCKLPEACSVPEFQIIVDGDHHHVALHTLTCSHLAGHEYASHISDDSAVDWYDTAPGATPATESPLEGGDQ